MSGYRIGDCDVANTFAEAFPLRYARLIVTAASADWALEATRAATGVATSMAGGRCEAAIERTVSRERTPDGRPGIALLLFATDRERIEAELIDRVGQGVMSCPTTACFDGLPEAVERVELGSALSRFGDGFQLGETIAGEAFWRVPVTAGEFLVTDTAGIEDGVGGGNLVVGAGDEDRALAAAVAAAAAMRGRGVALPAPGGIVRSGAKLGALATPSLPASTDHRLAPTLRAQVTGTLVPEAIAAMYEIVFDAVSLDTARNTMRRGLHAAAAAGAAYVTAAEFDGKLGQLHLPLSDLRDAP